MTNQEQENFIRQNRGLSLDQLSEKTGLRQRTVRKILERTAGENASPVFHPGETKTTGKGPNSAVIWISALLPVLLTLLFYLRVLNNGFLNLDDHPYILDNTHIRSMNGDFFHWCFTTFYEGNWIPLTWISLALDYALGHLNPWLYHFHSLILHLLNTLLVFLVALKLLNFADKENLGPKIRPVGWTISASFLTAVLFGLHPLHVESVAWASEQRDLLCGFFYLLCLLLYMESASHPEWKPWPWFGSLVSFSLALMAKPMAVSLPLVLVLLDYWPLNRLKKDNWIKTTREKTPFFILSLVEIILAPLAQAGAQYLKMNQVFPFHFRILNAFHSLLFYFQKMIWPFDLHPFYPLSSFNPYSPACFVSVFLFLGVTGLCVYWRKRRPWLGITWLYYVITLGPVLGLVQTGSQAAADRFTYLPSVGPFLLFAAGLCLFLLRNRAAVGVAGLTMAAGLGFLTTQQLALWHDDISFFENINQFCPDASSTYHNILSEAYLKQRNLDNALRESQKAVALNPDDAVSRSLNGSILLDLNRDDEAATEFQEALRLDPQNVLPYLNLAIVYAKKGMKKDRLAELEKAIQIDPRCAPAYRDMGVFYQDQKNYGKAAEAFKTASDIDPQNGEYLFDLAGACELSGDYNAALDCDRRGIQLNPANALIYANMGMTYLLKGDKTNALEALEQAEKLAPPNPAFFQQLGQAFNKAGDQQKAEECFEKSKTTADENHL